MQILLLTGTSSLLGHIWMILSLTKLRFGIRVALGYCDREITSVPGGGCPYILVVRITLSLNQGVELTLVASYGRQIIPRTMSVPGADGHTRRQAAALGFSTPKDSVPQPFSKPVIATLPKKGFY